MFSRGGEGGFNVLWLHFATCLHSPLGDETLGSELYQTHQVSVMQ